MTWDYRLVEYVQTISGEKYSTLFIHEVYYDEDKNITGYLNMCAPQGDNLEEITADLNYMVAALKKPILKLSELKKLIKKGSKNDNEK